MLTLLPGFVTGCREATAPGPVRIALAVVDDAVIRAPAGSPIPDVVRVVAVDAGKRTPVKDVQIDWRIEGSGSLSAATSVTDEYGVATVRVTMGTTDGVVTATTARLQFGPASIALRVTERPVIHTIAPVAIAPGDEITLTGAHFSAAAHENTVLFDEVPGTVLSASAAQLRVRAPACLPRRTVQVRSAIGYASSATIPLTSTGSAAGRITLAPGQLHRVSTPADLACIQLGGTAGARYLLTVHNAEKTLQPPRRVELRALGTQQPVTNLADHAVHADFAQDWEAALRRSESMLGADGPILPHVSAPSAVPQVGDSRSFNVLNASNGFDRITATVGMVSERAVIYLDDEAAGAFITTDMQHFVNLFDDPIYPTHLSVFGAPSDVDGNGRILILFTPRVNALTPRGSSSFVTGFFYGCDLLSRSRCSGTNGAEVFYSLVPDPDGRWGDRRSNPTVMSAVPPVLAHEFQHMIQFARRGFSNDVLWLAEALAHMAEQVVAEVFSERGDVLRAEMFRSVVRSNGRQYLNGYRGTTLIAENAPGTTAMRGGAWLLLMHIRGHHGGNDLLRRLTGSPRSGVESVVAETGRPWLQLVSDFGVALWAHEAPDVGGLLATEARFIGYSPRTDLTPVGGIYQVQPDNVAWGDFAITALVPPASQTYVLVQAPSTAVEPLNFVMSGPLGAPFPAGSGAALSILRIR